LPRTRSLFAAALVAVSVPALVAGCGGDDSSGENPQDVIEATFNNEEQITSGVLDLTLEASAGDQGTFSASVSGPFQGVEDDPTAVPQLDLDATLSGEGAGQSVNFEGGLVVTEDNAFVEYQGDAYEIGADAFNQLKGDLEAQADKAGGESGDSTASFREACERGIEAEGGDPSACDFDISAWFTDLSNDGTEDVGGASTTHISGSVDVQQMLTDFVGLAQAVPGAEGQLDLDSGLDQVDEAISEASFNVYTGEDDDLLRKLDANVAIDPSAIAGATPVPIGTIDLSFSVELSEVNEEQTVEAPSNAKSIDELEQQLEGLGALGLGGDIDDLGGGDLDDLGGDGGNGGGGDAGATQDYLDCVENAGNDPQEAAKCLEELQ
jgi:hypothetical protein